MEIQGFIKEVMPEQSGVAKSGNEWRKQDFVLEVVNGQYTDLICFNMFGDNIAPLQVGQEVKAQINIKSREYNGRYYTEVQAWKVEVLDDAGSQAPAPKKANPQYIQPEEEMDDLPF